MKYRGYTYTTDESGQTIAQRPVSIYALTDESDNIFYIGHTLGTLKRRLIQHICTARKAARVTPNIQKIRDLNFNIKIVLLHNVTITGGGETERTIEAKYIKKYMDQGIELTNIKNPA